MKFSRFALESKIAYEDTPGEELEKDALRVRSGRSSPDCLAKITRNGCVAARINEEKEEEKEEDDAVESRRRS